MNLNKELHLNEFREIIHNIENDLNEEIEELESRIVDKKVKLREIQEVNDELEEPPWGNDDTLEESLARVKMWACNFEDEIYSQDYMGKYETGITEHLYRFQNVYLTKEILDLIDGFAEIDKVKLSDKFPVIKIWHDIFGSESHGTFIVEYYKYRVSLSTRPDTNYSNVYYESDVLKEIVNINDLYHSFDFENSPLSNLNKHLDNIMPDVSSSIPREFKLGLIIIGLAYYFNYGDSLKFHNTSSSKLENLLTFRF